MEKVKIIIIDSGVRESHPRFAGDDIRGYTFLLRGADKYEYRTIQNNSSSKGTVEQRNHTNEIYDRRIF